MKNIKSVSVALTTYNGSNYLTEQLESILHQTYPLKEIIISDDCSSDSTNDIITIYKNKYPKLIKYFQNAENIGYIKNFEKAITNCSGEYIALCDQDDAWDLNKIEILIKNIGNNLLIHSDARLIDMNGNILYESYTAISNKYVQNPSFSNICINNIVTGCTVLLNSRLLNIALPFPTCIPHDQWLALLAADTKNIAYYDKALISYRQHSKNTIGAKTSKQNVKNLTISSFSFKRNIMSKYHSNLRRYQKLSLLTKSIKNKISIKNYIFIRKLTKYYKSYYYKMFRFHSFFFNIRYFKELNQKKYIFQSLNNLFYSLFGIKIINIHFNLKDILGEKTF
ncbi:hypothetical protein MASR2M78_31460 [Treponema sp.]